MTLTEAAYWFKRFGIVVVAVIGVFIVILTLLFSSPKEEVPPEYLEANCACTELKEDFLKEELQLESLELGSNSELVFQVETTTGQIDSLPKIINVYEFDNKGQSLNSQLQASTIANDLGFNPDAIIRKDSNTYVWLDTKTHRTLEIDARTLNFVLTTESDYVRNISSKQNVPSNSEAISIATNTLRQANLLDDDYNNSTSNKEVFNIDINPDGTYSEAPSPGEADLLRIDFLRRKSLISIRENLENSESMINSLERKMLGSDEEIFVKSEESISYNGERVKVYDFSTYVFFGNPYDSNISVYVGPEDPNVDNSNGIYRIEYTNWPIKEFPCGTYELIAPSEAIQKIQDGEGYLASLIPLENGEGDYVVPYQTKTVKRFIIHKVSIGYYEPKDEAKFLQPIYVVTGSAYLENDQIANFVFYVPAINYDLVTNEVVQEDTSTEVTEDILDL